MGRGEGGAVEGVVEVEKAGRRREQKLGGGGAREGGGGESARGAYGWVEVASVGRR